MLKRLVAQKILTRQIVPHVVLVISILFVSGVSVGVWYSEQNAIRVQFTDKVAQFENALLIRIKNNEQVLQGAAGLYAASKSVERDEFENYIASLQVERNYLGVQSVGFIAWIKPTDLHEYTDLVRKDGFPDFTLWPQGVRDVYSAIVYAAPSNTQNREAIGFDVYTNKENRAAMDYAVENNTASLSEKNSLPQSSSGGTRSGIRMYLPIYKKNMPLDSIEQRWLALQGFVYSAYQIETLVLSVIDVNTEDLHISIYSGDSISEERIIFSSSADKPILDNGYRDTVPIKIYGKTWLIVADSTPDFISQRKHYVSFFVFLCGVVFSVVLFVWLKSIVLQRQLALSMAEGMTSDIFEKNKQLKVSEERFQLALESSGMGIWSWQLAENVIEWDRSMFTLFGLTEQKSLNSYESFLAHLHDEDRDRVFEEVAQAIERKHGFDTEYRVVWPDNSIHFISSRAKIIFDEGDVAISMIGTCWDVTERKRLDKLKTEFVSTVSHELRTPLTAVTGALGLAVSGAIGELPEKAKLTLDIAYKNAQRLKLLINDLLDMDKLLAGKLEFHCEPQLLLPLIKRAVTENQAYADQFTVRYAIAPIDATYKINVEESRFLQVMANYLSNAAKFSKANSDVIVSVSKYKHFLRVAVSDNGPGIAADAQGHIFEKFYQVDSSDTRKKGGTGLGLAITKEIVQRMGGNVGFMSDVGMGSTFYADFIRVDN